MAISKSSCAVDWSDEDALDRETDDGKYAGDVRERSNHTPKALKHSRKRTPNPTAIRTRTLQTLFINGEEALCSRRPQALEPCPVVSGSSSMSMPATMVYLGEAHRPPRPSQDEKTHGKA